MAIYAPIPAMETNKKPINDNPHARYSLLQDFGIWFVDIAVVDGKMYPVKYFEWHEYKLN